MKISLGCDHGAFALKEHLKEYLTRQGHRVVDCGTDSTDSCDYPIYARAAAQQVASGECERGIVLCTTGIGVSVVANKVGGVRCALCRDLLSAQLTRQHNDANMLALAGGFTGPFEAERLVDAFLGTPFEGGRHQRRVDLVMETEGL
ncbi:MAG TPA: ribose 5-phosphate isomerase B [Candidatus Enterenecus merdae]|nr:ribose 5-phosphate isomerase B [Candidatus Enterenecus merdae]